MKDVAVVSYCRTGIAKAQRGALDQTHGVPMTSHVLRNAVKRAGIDPAEVEDVVVGCGLPEGATATTSHAMLRSMPASAMRCREPFNTARTRAPRASPCDRGRVYGRRHVDRRVPRATL